MQRPSGAQVLGFVASALVAAVWYIVHDLFGQTAGFRFWGVMLLLTAVFLTLRRTIPFAIGSTDLAPLQGWHKAYVLIPAYCIAICVIVWPHQVACAVTLKGYVCVP